MNKGYTKRWRGIEEWEWYKTPHMAHFFMHIVGKANHKDGKWQGVDVERGQLITGRKQLAIGTGLSEQTVRTCLERLKSTSEITIKVTNKFSIITVVGYEKYQTKEESPTSTSTSYLTNNQPTTNQQLTTNKKVKNDKNEKNTNSDLEKEIVKWLSRHEKKYPQGYMLWLRKEYDSVLDRAWRKAKNSAVVNSPSDLVELCKFLQSQGK